MRVTAELSRRRLAVALLFIALLPGVLAFAAASYDRPELPPGAAAYNPRPLPVMPILTSMQARELERSHRLSSGAPPPSVQLTGPTFPDLMPTIVLAPREEPYRLSELRQKLPSAFGSVGDALLLRASIEAPTGTHLFIDAAQTPDVRLTSSSKKFVTIISRGGEIDIAGTTEQVLRLTSWDEERQTNDTNPEDGRSFILSQGGRMDITRADIGYLGFGASGTSSGIAWRGEPAGPGSPGAPAYGDVTASTLHHNWFGAYTFEARNMRWAHNSFAYNDAYGFDPHDLSNDFVVEHNVAHGNGRHGFIFSRGCDRNIMRNNLAFDNRGHGFMIDDGRSEDAELAPARFLPSNDNQIVNNHAYDNDGSGVEIEGGTGNVVKDNVLERNYVGVRLKNGASAAITGNEISDSRMFGVDVLANAGEVTVAHNRISKGWASIALGKAGAAQLTGNVLEDASTPLVVAGQAVRDEPLTEIVSRVYKWNPLLILWTAILGTPVLVFFLHSLVLTVLRRRRGRRARASVS